MFRFFASWYRTSTHLCNAKKSGHGWNNHSEWFEWERLLHLFSSTKWAYVTCSNSINVVLALQYCEPQIWPDPDPPHGLLPLLHNLCIQESDLTPPLQKAVLSFILSCLSYGYTIAVEYER